MMQKSRWVRWALVGLGLLGALTVINSDLLWVFAQTAGKFQLLPMQVIGPSNLNNLVLNLTVRYTYTPGPANAVATEVPFQLGFSLMKIGQLSERRDGVEVGECFIAACPIKVPASDNPTTPAAEKSVDKVVQLILKINQNEVLEPNATYQLSVFKQPYNIASDGCANLLCVSQNFYKYDVPELHPILLNTTPPSPAQEGAKIFVQTIIENTGAGLLMPMPNVSTGTKLEVSFKYCRQLGALPCDPDIEFKKVTLDSTKPEDKRVLDALTPKFLGAASTVTIPNPALPLDDKNESQVVLDADQLKLTGQIRLKVSLKLTLPPNAQGLPIREADDSNNELITPYRILARTAITQFALTANGHLGNAIGAIIFFDRNTRQLCTYPRALFQLTDPRRPQEVAALLNCFSYDLDEVTDLIVRSSGSDPKLCDVLIARPDGRLLRARCALNKNEDLVYLINPKAKENLQAVQLGTEPFDFTKDKFDPSRDRIVVDEGKRINQLLLIDQLNKLLIATARGKVYISDVVKSENFDRDARPDLLIDAGSDTNFDKFLFVGANVVAVGNSRSADKGQLYLLRADANGKFTAQQFKVGNLAGPNFETTGRIVAIDYDSEFRRLIVATSQAVIFYTLADSNIPVIPAGTPIANCQVSTNADIRDILFFKRFINRASGSSLVMAVMIGLASKARSEGEVQFLNALPSKVSQCTKADTPNGAALLTAGAVTKLAKIVDIPSTLAFRSVAPDQPTYLIATALDGRVYPFRLGARDSDPEKLLAQPGPNDEGLLTPFFPVQPLQESPFIELTPSTDKSPAVLIFYVSDAVYCRRYAPLEDSIQRQLTLCSESASQNTFLDARSPR
ncbi:hypothetical protein HYR54_12065 [Candidatus Acetothermia bacterium]|nr:hypothetical protein [Candidatus Acetothermia bacterium]